MPAPLIIPYFIPHRGCPHQCIFCNQHLITSVSSESCQMPDLEATIEAYLGYKGARSRVELAFFGGNFLGLPQSDILGLLRRVHPYMERGQIHGVRCSTRPDTVTRKHLELVAPLGMTLVELGVQSMDDKVLKRAGRGHTRADTVAAVDLLREKGIDVGVQVMAGLPGDTSATALESCRALAAMKPDLARIYPVLVLAGSRLARWYEKGRYEPLALEQAVAQVADMWRIFSGAGVNVVRMGLQASEMMDDPSQVLAGPWHPAFGHLVYSELMFEKVCGKMDLLLQGDANRSGRVLLCVHPKSVSRLQGNRKENLDKLRRRFPEVKFLVRTSDGVHPDQISVEWD
ncbi:MAG TPA: histone acetyltransferase [Desulfobacteraceae bacterium]|nr:histone acetyltransferase [Desulfobacteraceae bacterium]